MTDERGIIITQARELSDDYPQDSYEGPGRYQGIADRELAAAIEVIYGHGFADGQGGSTEYGRHGARVGAYVLWTDDQGFLDLDSYGSAEQAQEALDEEDARQDGGDE